MAEKKKTSSSTKHAQIKKASTQTFVAVAIASVVVSISIVMINILRGNAQYNSRVHGVQEETRDNLNHNLSVAPDLNNSFRGLEIGSNLIPGQPDDKTNSEIILDALPSKFDFPALASSIANLASVSSVGLESFRGVDLGSDATQSSPNPAAEQIPFTVEVKGSYVAISKFLKSIENSIRPLKVISMTLNGTDSNLRASIVMETSYQPAFDLNIETRTIQ